MMPSPRRNAQRITCIVTLATLSIAFACGGSTSGSIGGAGAAGGSGGGRATGGTIGIGGAASGGSGGTSSTGGIVGRGGRQSAGGTGSGGLGAGGFIACPPCAAPPGPNCVGSGPCGCGPYVCTEDAGPPPGLCGGTFCLAGTACCGPTLCGRCVPEGSGVYCPDYCEFCSGTYRRSTGGAFCTGDHPVQWEVTAPPATNPFNVPLCQDAGTNLIRYCCTTGFAPGCP